MEHFHEDDFVRKNNKISLKNLAVPTVFATNHIFNVEVICDAAAIDCNVDEVAIEPTEANSAESDGIKKLQDIIESQSEQHNGEIQKLKVELDILKNCCKTKSDEARGLKQQIQRLNDMIQSLNTELDTCKNQNLSDLAKFSAKVAQTQDPKVSNRNFYYYFT